MSRMCIAVDDNMLAAALAVPEIKRQVSPSETLRARAKRCQVGNAPYPSWYLFGSKEKSLRGLVDCYTRQGVEVFLCPESKLTPSLDTDYIDTQFCTVEGPLYAAWAEQNLKVFGYLPETFSSKTFLAAAVKKHQGQRYLPNQATYTKDSRAILPHSHNTVWIVKTPYGAAGSNRNGSPYTVWQSEELEKQLSSLLAALQDEEELICSEFVVTNDPYAQCADHVVHKMPFIVSANAVAPYGVVCQKFIYHCNWSQLHERRKLSLGEFIGPPDITVGYIGSIEEFHAFVQVLAFHQQRRVMLSVDFIIPPDGIPRYLESNKLAATFAEQFDPDLPSLIDFYAQLPLV
ncbi:MAG: hypothetical protein NUK65_08520 [Firmicutes bacterium]|nr:hypothetical protein [Bacillota bacterium]